MSSPSSRTRDAASGLVRLTVTSATRRVDLALPGQVPVAELTPELARRVGVLDPCDTYAGYRLVTTGGAFLAADLGLRAQGVADGAVLTVAAVPLEEPAPRYDDVAEALADVLVRDRAPWLASAGRRTAWWGGHLLLLAAGSALLLQAGSDVAGPLAVTGSVLLLLAAIHFSHAGAATEVVLATAITACGYAAVAGILLATPSSGWAPAAGGGALAAAGSVAALGVTRRRVLLTTPIALGTTMVVTGLLVQASPARPAVAVAVVLVAVVLAGGGIPRLALAACGVPPEPLTSAAPVAWIGEAVDPGRVAADARLAHDAMLAMAATEGLVLVLAAPVTVSLGPTGAAVAALASTVVGLGRREHQAGVEALVGMGSGLLGMLVTGVSVLWLQPSWRPAAGVLLATAGAALLAPPLLPRAASARLDRIGDLLESLALVGLLPVLVVASGVVPALAG